MSQTGTLRSGVARSTILTAVLVAAFAAPCGASPPDGVAKSIEGSASVLQAAAHHSDSTRALSAARLRSRLIYDEAHEPAADSEQARSVPLALGLSAFVPGLGQAYNRDWIRSAVAVAIEGGLVLGYLLWRANGRDREEAYKAYAHDHWDPARYAAWLNDYAAFLEQSDGAELEVEAIVVPDGIDFTRPATWSVQENQEVRAFFNDVRVVEDVVYHPETGAAFSHNLPYFAEQQYYELIGKYFQFAPGWRDYPAWKEDETFTGAIDPERTGPNGSKPNVQGRFLQYAKDHAHANTLLRRASRASAFLVLNHLVAAFDAAISAKLHNDRVETDVRLGRDRFERPHVFASLTLRL